MRAVSFSIFALVLILMTSTGHCFALLRIGFYNDKCGQNDIEQVIHEVVKQKFMADPDTVSDLVRMSFHDCFVRGCDASLFLDGKDTEKFAEPNLTLGGFDTIDDIKTAVEKVCPGVVSCADILVIATRSAISLAGGKWFPVETGRRDGRVSLKNEALANIPPPTIPIRQAIQIFADRGLTIGDFVVLLGGHTVGTAHCRSFKERLYNFQNTNGPDPTISAPLLQLLQSTCPLNSQEDNQAFLDQTPSSHFTIDNAYYNQIIRGNGTMEIDQNLASDPLTGGLVRVLAGSNQLFSDTFWAAMVKMARIGVLTGNQGEIRKTCRAVNS